MNATQQSFGWSNLTYAQKQIVRQALMILCLVGTAFFSFVAGAVGFEQLRQLFQLINEPVRFVIAYGQSSKEAMAAMASMTFLLVAGTFLVATFLSFLMSFRKS